MFESCVIGTGAEGGTAPSTFRDFAYLPSLFFIADKTQPLNNFKLRNLKTHTQFSPKLKSENWAQCRFIVSHFVKQLKQIK